MKKALQRSTKLLREIRAVRLQVKGKAIQVQIDYRYTNQKLKNTYKLEVGSYSCQVNHPRLQQIERFQRTATLMYTELQDYSSISKNQVAKESF